MKGLDTNVLLRLLLRDDADEAARAQRFVERAAAEAPLWINRVVLVELVWVLESGYRYRRQEVAGILANLLRTKSFMIEGAEEAWAAFRRYRDVRADFADCLIGATNRAAGCAETATFDRAAAALPGFVVLGA
ncbi:MAG: type II toxin-antitoxin system VapC family toxin [Alphaproteobacteria bacterium]|nr:type II toxin-antitoxin system VapC family toxin [Alphaproteobacteria bacterium]